MDKVYNIISTTISSCYRHTSNKSEIRIIYDLYPYERVDINDFVNDVVDILNKNNIKYKKRMIKFFSEYPSFEIYEGDNSIGIIILGYGIKI